MSQVGRSGLEFLEVSLLPVFVTLRHIDQETLPSNKRTTARAYSCAQASPTPWEGRSVADDYALPRLAVVGVKEEQCEQAHTYCMSSSDISRFYT